MLELDLIKTRRSDVIASPCLSCKHRGKWRQVLSDQDIKRAKCSAIGRDIVLFDGLTYTDKVFDSPQWPIEDCDKWEHK